MTTTTRLQHHLDFLADCAARPYIIRFRYRDAGDGTHTIANFNGVEVRLRRSHSGRTWVAEAADFHQDSPDIAVRYCCSGRDRRAAALDATLMALEARSDSLTPR